MLKAAGLNEGVNGKWARVVCEKPFGKDLATAKALNASRRRTLFCGKGHLPH